MRVLTIAANLVSISMACVLAAGCTTEKTSSPTRTATEQLLISTAADRAAKNLSFQMPASNKVFVDSTNFEGTDGKYAISVIKDEFLKRGMRLVADRKDADAIVEIRSGALSIDESTAIVGIPEFNIPIPAAGNLTFPEIALFKKSERQGLAKFAATGYSTQTGELISSSGPKYGFSEKTQWVVALFVSWTTSDLLPPQPTENEGYFFTRSLPLQREDLPFQQWR